MGKREGEGGEGCSNSNKLEPPTCNCERSKTAHMQLRMEQNWLYICMCAVIGEEKKGGEIRQKLASGSSALRACVRLLICSR